MVDGSEAGNADYLPDECMFADSFGSSEAVGFCSSITMKDMPVKTAKFTTNDYCKVFDENDAENLLVQRNAGLYRFRRPDTAGLLRG